MFVLRQIIKRGTKQYIEQIWRACNNISVPSSVSAAATSQAELSLRAKDWQQAHQKYAQHPLICYSSHLESQEEFMSYRRLKTFRHKQALEEKRNLGDIQQRPVLWASEERLEPSKQKYIDGDFPHNWMEDYEFYADDDNVNGQIGKYGTADPTIPPSTVPCSGCGAKLHCNRITLPGYLPREIFKGRTVQELQTIICQRCHFLKHYNIALELEVTADSYVDTISRIQDEYALAMVIVDLLDFPCSIWPGMQQLLGPKRSVFVVGNKVDLLPRDSSSYLDHVKRSLMQQMLQSGFDKLNIKHISLISAKTGYGIEELITQLHKIWCYKGDVYLLGCTNVGKSTLFNILLQSDYCRPEATELVRKATTCPWPGTTLKLLKFPIYRPSEIRVYQRYRRLMSERGQKAAEMKLRRDQARQTGAVGSVRLEGTVGRTFVKDSNVQDAFAMSSGTQPIVSLNERSLEYRQAKWCYDTPGVMHPAQCTNLLTEDELQHLTPQDMVVPRAVRLKPGMSVFMSGLARLDFVSCHYLESDWVKALLFCSLRLPVVITQTVHADEMYKQYLGSDVLGLPFGDTNRLARWPGLQCHEENFQVVGSNKEGLSCDFMLSSAGWIGLHLPYASECTFRAWTPHARGIYVRTPALTPYAERLVGKRIRNSMAYNLGKPFVFRK